MKKILLIGLTFFALQLQSQNKIESSVEEYYNNGVWELNAGTNYQYDANNNLLSETRYSYINNGYTPSYKSIYTYNAANKAVTRTDQNWNDVTNTFDNTYKTTFTYNGTGKLITILDQEWMSGAWVNAYKSDVTYNGNLFATVTSPTWNGSQWINNNRNTPTYTGTNLTQWLEETWDGMQWNNSYRTVLTYNAANKITAVRYDSWTNTAWEEDYNTNYILDSNGNRTSAVNSYLGVLEGKEDFTYDAAAQMSSFGHPFKDKTGVDYVFQDFPYVNKILNTLFYSYDISTSSYDLQSRISYNYQAPLVLDRTSFEIKNIKLYPNPANASFELSGLTQAEKVSIYNVLGTKVFEGTIDTNQKVDVQNLTSGLYFLNFENGSSLKFIKE